jgi:predicted DNA-binding transcriptional regulator AlpA
MNLTNPILAQRVAVTRTLVDRLQSLDEELQLPMFLALSDVAALTGMSEPTLRRMELCGEFPRRVNIGPRRKGVALRDYIEWVANRRAGLAGADGATQTVEGKSAIRVAKEPERAT